MRSVREGGCERGRCQPVQTKRRRGVKGDSLSVGVGRDVRQWEGSGETKGNERGDIGYPKTDEEGGSPVYGRDGDTDPERGSVVVPRERGTGMQLFLFSSGTGGPRADLGSPRSHKRSTWIY